MAEKSAHNSSIGKFLGEFTKQQANRENRQVIVNIDIHRLVTNPQNFYGMRNVEELASMISISHQVDPLTVTRIEGDEEKYLLIAGHRRLAAWQMLLDQGVETDTTLPCVILKFNDVELEKQDGTKVTFDAKQMSFLYLMFSNMGQRKERTIYEQLREIKEIEPFARTIYESSLKDKDISGPFRKFFAENFLQMSSSALQRKLSIEKLTENVIQAIQDGILSETAATTSLVKLTPEQQDQYIEDLRAGRVSGKVQSIREELGQASEEEVPAEEAPEEPVEPSEDAEPEEAPDDSPKTIENDFEPAPADEEDEEPSESMSSNPPEPKQEMETHEEAPIPAPKAAPEPQQPRRIPIPQEIGDPQEEADHWWNSIVQPIYDAISDAEEQQRIATDAGDEVAASQWGVRVATAKYKMALFKKAVEEMNGNA